MLANGGEEGKREKVKSKREKRKSGRGKGEGDQGFQAPDKGEVIRDNANGLTTRGAWQTRGIDDPHTLLSKIILKMAFWF